MKIYIIYLPENESEFMPNLTLLLQSNVYNILKLSTVLSSIEVVKKKKKTKKCI
jgi:hypothetical protein